MQASSFLGSTLAVRQPCAPSTSARGGQTVTCVATPSRPPASNKAKRSKVEIIKEKSDFLRHPLMQVCAMRRTHRACSTPVLPALPPPSPARTVPPACSPPLSLAPLATFQRPLRSPVSSTLQELVTEEPSIAEEAVQLMKFHGSYMQDNREQRTFGSGKSYQFMMRTRQPAGGVTNQLYLVMDELADLVGAG